ncbi:hypothetical protein J2S74_002872 [Evansella vedderi]|uniref:SAF domain-containing protein n=1 Tax=Evansella vedderi TaxID=38282 RepID=A0ABT9ZZG1_9BACI|nr:hypothetical protein [Evansella vedderi]MDQ0255490.1 hypothetical protein [Evansella vedderi]
MKPYLKITLGILMAAVVIGFIVFWDLYLKDGITSEEVVIVRPHVQIEAKEAIQREHLMIESRHRSSLVDGAVLADQIDEIVGYDAAVLLVGNSILSTSHIDFDDIVPNPEEGEAIRPIPDEWVYAKPGSLRRKDRIDIYVIQAIDTHNINFQEEMARASREIADDEHQRSDDVKLQIEPILTNIPVIYAKDSSNREVVGQTRGDSRLDASGRISDLEVNLNREEFKILMDHINKGYKLYITYN